MKNKNSRNMLYLALILILSIGCNENKAKHSEDEKYLQFESKKAVILNVNTREFPPGTVLTLGDSGQLIEANAKAVDEIFYLVVGEDSVKVFILDRGFMKVN